MKGRYLLPLYLLLTMTGFSQTVKPDTTGTFTNPLLPGGPDPWVIREQGVYYYMATTGRNITIRKTKAMSALSTAPATVVWTAPVKGPDARDIWAPELHRLDGKWYLYYTAGSSDSIHPQHTFVLENAAADPTTGTWSSKGQIRDTEADYFAIDGTVFSYKGNRYFIWSGHNGKDNVQRIYIARMKNPWTLASGRVEIAAPQYAWEKNGINEGPEILVNKQQDVFLVFSVSGCWTDDYALGLMRLKKNADPLVAANWTKMPAPILSGKPENGAFSPGHNGFFKSADGKEDWIIYHANSRAGQGCGGQRNPRIQRFSWDDNGLPVIGEPVKIGTPQRKPAGE